MATISIYDVCSHIRAGRYVPGQGGPGRNGLKVEDSVAAGLHPTKPPTKVGLVQLTPEQAAGVLVEQVSVNGQVDGYQREAFSLHVKKIAEAMLAGADVGEATLAVDGGRVFSVDGQHRLCGAVTARKPIWAVIRPMTLDKRAERFASQNKARKVAGDVIVLSANDPISRYVKEAVAANPSNPWSSTVGVKSTESKISPALAAKIIQTYSLNRVGSVVGGHQSPSLSSAARFERQHADELHALISVFGNKRTNPLAFRPPALSAITHAALVCVRRGDDPTGDAARWLRHMGSFPWADFAWLTKERDIRQALISHWNKRLSARNKVRID